VVLCISVAYAVVQCLSIHLSIWVSGMFMYSVKMNKDIFKIFSPYGSHTHCSRICILRFFKIKKNAFLRFLEMTCQKNVENVIKVLE